MGGVCICDSCTCRPVLAVFVILVTICLVHCSESPAAFGKLHQRGSQWAVGHLMGKKSIENLPALQDTNQDSDDLTASERGVTQSRYEGLIGVLMQHKKQRQMAMNDDLFRRGWREEDRDYLREMPHLFLLASKLQDNDYT
ncbi:gastrin-releasing peptide [Genypterus blacodes]|uniref:gastrin-releasing peptide n=1 Tax=Genypterus blacodes TaxID=154954 RepID=UPI003F773392